MHTAAFGALGLPHLYSLCEGEIPEALGRALRSARAPDTVVAGTLPVGFSGGNVTIPLKQLAIPFCDVISPAAAKCGGVNVLVVIPGSDGGRFVFGDNTDWLGIYWPIAQRRWGAASTTTTTTTTMTAAATTTTTTITGGGKTIQLPPYALLIGAGATARSAAYAAFRLGLSFYVHNPRTPEKASVISSAFAGGRICKDLTPHGAMGGGGGAATPIEFCLPPYPPTVIINTLPSSLNWTPPQSAVPALFPTQGPLPIVFDVAYLPRQTPLLALARERGCQVIEGIEMLITQGVASMALWLGKAAHSGDCVVEAPDGEGGVPVVEMARAAYRALEAAATTLPS